MNLREKYGEWGLILGATEGVGKAFCEKIAAGGMNVVMVGRREEKLNVLAAKLKPTRMKKGLLLSARSHLLRLRVLHLRSSVSASA